MQLVAAAFRIHGSSKSSATSGLLYAYDIDKDASSTQIVSRIQLSSQVSSAHNQLFKQLFIIEYRTAHCILHQFTDFAR